MEPTALLTAAQATVPAADASCDRDDDAGGTALCVTATQLRTSVATQAVPAPATASQTAASKSLQQPFSAGDRVLAGRYHLLELLGRGGFGSVWRARDELLSREVAVKELFVDGAPSGSAREHVLREAQAAVRVSTPGAVAVYDVLEDGGRPYIVMELLSGRTLAQTVAERGPLPPSDVIRIGLQLLDTLEAAHAAGVLHRDLKPANIMLTDDLRRVVLMDFGIAKLVGPTGGATLGAVGTPAFMAPELANEWKATSASDLYSLGVSLRCALEGGLLRQDHPADVRPGVARQDHRRLSTAGPLIPVLEALLHENPHARPSAVELRRRLELARQALEARPTRLPQTVPLPIPTRHEVAGQSQPIRGAASRRQTEGQGRRTRQPAALQRLAALAVFAAVVALGAWTARSVGTTPPGSSGASADRSGAAAAPQARERGTTELDVQADAQPSAARDDPQQVADAAHTQPSTPPSTTAALPSTPPAPPAPPAQAVTPAEAVYEPPTLTDAAAARVGASRYRADLVVNTDVDQMRAGYHLTVDGVRVRRAADRGFVVEGTVHNPQPVSVRAVLQLAVVHPPSGSDADSPMVLTFTEGDCVPASGSSPIGWELPIDMFDPPEALAAGEPQGLREYTDFRVLDSSSVVGCGPTPAH